MEERILHKFQLKNSKFLQRRMLLTIAIPLHNLKLDRQYATPKSDQEKANYRAFLSQVETKNHLDDFWDDLKNDNNDPDGYWFPRR